MDISLTSPCHVTFEIHCGKLISISEKQITYSGQQKVGIPIQDSYRFLTNIDFDSRKGRFFTKKMSINMIIITSKSKKKGGQNIIDLSDILNMERCS